MIISRDGSEGLALRAFAAAGRTKKEKCLISHHDNNVYTATPERQTSIVIPSRIEASRRTSLIFCYRVFRVCFAPFKTTKKLRSDPHSLAARRDRNEHSRQLKQRLYNRGQAQRFCRAKISYHAGG